MAMCARACGSISSGAYGRLAEIPLAYRSFPPTPRPSIGILMNFFARLECSKPAHVNNPRHEATCKW